MQDSEQPPQAKKKIFKQPSFPSLELPRPIPNARVVRKPNGYIDLNVSLAHLVKPKQKRFSEKELDHVFKKQKRQSAFELDPKKKAEIEQKTALERTIQREAQEARQRFRQDIPLEEKQRRQSRLSRLNSKLRAGESLIRRRELLGDEDAGDDPMDDGVSNTDLPLHDMTACDWHAVIGQGHVDAELMIIVDSPTAEECNSAKALSGRRSIMLKEIMLKAGIDVQSYCYVTNVMKIGNRRKTYSFDEIEEHLEYLLEEINIIRPKQLLCMGPLSITLAHHAFRMSDSMRAKNSIWRGEGQERDDGVHMEQLYQLQKHGIEQRAVQFRQFNHVSRIYMIEEVGKFFENRENEHFRETWIKKLGTLKDMMTCERMPYVDLEESLERYHQENGAGSLDEAARQCGVEFTSPPEIRFDYNQHEAPVNPDLHLDLQQSGKNLRFYLIERVFSEAENSYVLFGRLRDGNTVSVIVKNPKFFFWVNHNTFMPQLKENSGDYVYSRPKISDLNAAMRLYLLGQFKSSGFRYGHLSDDELWDQIGLKLEWDLKRSSIIFQKERSTFLKVSYNVHSHLPKIQQYLKQILVGCQFFEAKVSPIKFLNLYNEVSTFSWVEVEANALEPVKRRYTSSKYEYEVDIKSVLGKDPIKRDTYQPDPEDETHARIRTLQFDGEMIKLMSTNSSIPIPEVHPIGRLCAVVSDKNDSVRPSVLDLRRNTKRGQEREVVSSGRANYLEVVAFIVGAHEELEAEPFKPDKLPWVPQRPKSLPTKVFKQNKDKCLKRTYKWNQFIKKLVDWIGYVGTYRAERLLPPQLYTWVRAFSADSKSVPIYISDNERSEEHIYNTWRSHIVKIFREWKKRAPDTAVEIDSVQPPEHVTSQLEIGSIQYNWKTFNTKPKQYFFRNERDMLAGFVEYCRQADIDGFSGHNICNFDMDYVIKRLRVLDIRWDEYWPRRGNGLVSLGRNNFQSFGRFSELSKDVLDKKVMETTANGKREFTIIQVPGRFSFDTLHWAQKDGPPGLSGVSLAKIAKKVLRDQKGDLPFTSIPHQFFTVPQNLTDYCKKDAELCERTMNLCDVQSFVVTSDRIIGDLTLGEFYNTGVQRKNVSIYQTHLRKSNLNRVFPDENPFSQNENGEYNEGNDLIGEEANAVGDDEDDDDKLDELESNLLNEQNLPSDQRNRLYAKLEAHAKKRKASYRGALCIKLKKAFYRVPLVSADFASLYPSIMKARNFGLNTIGTLEYFLSLGYTEAELWTSNEEWPDPWNNGKPRKWYFLKRKRLTEEQASKLPAFDDQPAGLAQCVKNADGTYSPALEVSDFAAILDFLGNLRNYYKGLMKKVGENNPLYKAYNAAQLAVKILMNSLYGATGVKCGKLACLPIGASVTYEGRNILQGVQDGLITYFDANIVGGDTDSVFAIFPNVKEPDDVFAMTEMLDNPDQPAGEDNKLVKAPFIEHVVKFINRRQLPGIQVLFEKLYVWANMEARKRSSYVSAVPFFHPATKKMTVKLKEQNKVDSKGNETKRRSTAPYAKKILKGFDKIMIGQVRKPVEQRKQEAVEFVRREVNKILEGDFDYTQMIITSYYGKSEDQYANKNHPTLVINRKRQKRGEEPYQLGERVPRVVVMNPNPKAQLYEKVEDPLYAMQNRIPLDLDYYIEKQLRKPFKRKTATIDPKMEPEMFADVIRWRKSLKKGEALHSYLHAKCELCGSQSLSTVCQQCLSTKQREDVSQHFGPKIQELEETVQRQNNVCYDCLGIKERKGQIACVNVDCSDMPKRLLPTALLKELREKKVNIETLFEY